MTLNILNMLISHSYTFFCEMTSYLCPFFLKILFIYLTEREITSRQRGRQRERGKQAPCRAESPMRGLIPGPWDHDLSQRRGFNPLSHPGVLAFSFLIIIVTTELSLKTFARFSSKYFTPIRSLNSLNSLWDR